MLNFHNLFAAWEDCTHCGQPHPYTVRCEASTIPWSNAPYGTVYFTPDGPKLVTSRYQAAPAGFIHKRYDGTALGAAAYGNPRGGTWGGSK